MICLPGPRVLAAAEEALANGVRALCVISSGFAETGAEGRERQEQLLALVRAHGARLLGPNCLGIASSKPKLNATFAPRALPPGRIGFSSQSGALGLALLEQSSARLGFSAFVSIGNKADVSSNDLLEWWEDDPETDVVLLYLESFGNPRKFARLSQRVARRKPILALKAGATAAGARAASSHTAALAGSEAAVDALFDRRACCGRERSRSWWTWRACSRASRSRAGGASACSPTPAASGSSAPTPARPPGSSFPSWAKKPSPRCARCSRATAASRIPSTCSARPPGRPTSGRSRRCSPTPGSTR